MIDKVICPKCKAQFEANMASGQEIRCAYCDSLIKEGTKPEEEKNYGNHQIQDGDELIHGKTFDAYFLLTIVLFVVLMNLWFVVKFVAVVVLVAAIVILTNQMFDS